MVDAPVIVMALLLIVVVGGMAWQKLRRDSREFDRLYRPAEQVLDDPFGEVMAFEGDYTFETEVFVLRAGRWRLRYWFDDEVVVKVDLLTVAGDDRQTLAIKSGAGELEFQVEAGRYFCLIEPTEAAPWEIEISPLGLPSARADG
jgi:hypothetical protein